MPETPDWDEDQKGEPLRSGRLLRAKQQPIARFLSRADGEERVLRIRKVTAVDRSDAGAEPERRVVDRPGAVTRRRMAVGGLVGVPAGIEPADVEGRSRQRTSTDARLTPLSRFSFPRYVSDEGARRHHERPDPALPCGFGLLAEGEGFEPSRRLSDA